MSELDKDESLNRRLLHDFPGRSFIKVDDTHWGELILPAVGENRAKTDQGLRIVMICSYSIGYLGLETIKEMERRHPQDINIVAVLTDDVINAKAKISARKRLWRYHDESQQLKLETATVESALSFGVPVYTGEVKVKWLHQEMKKWRPDVILMCGFGQLLDSFLNNLPVYGIYNFHPSDLAHNRGAGPEPFADISEGQATTTAWTVHRVADEIDAGPIVGTSPVINVSTPEGIPPADPQTLLHKLCELLPYLYYFLVQELLDKFRQGDLSPVRSLDFEALLPNDIKRQAGKPVQGQVSVDQLPEIDLNMFNHEGKSV